MGEVVSLVRKGNGVKVESKGWTTAKVSVDASLKQRLSGMDKNKPFRGRVEKVGGSGKSDQQQTLKLVEILG
ncbi:MAG: hypothetical protein Q7R76_00085 [Candidatus Woesearchaeota archaeon]|nr:hypothetical protein [Candidatus Woesearchaeota archaeon]